jgi:hypothetical protein
MGTLQETRVTKVMPDHRELRDHPERKVNEVQREPRLVKLLSV